VFIDCPMVECEGKLRVCVVNIVKENRRGERRELKPMRPVNYMYLQLR
jgi:hypothetical protein